MYAARQQRVRVLEALDDLVKQFRRREELWPLRVPPDPVRLDDVVERALPEGSRRFDASTLRSRTLLHLAWDDGSTWEAWMVVLPSGFKLYCDSGEEETRILASGGRNEGEESDRVFLQLLSESAGRHFGIEMSGGAPSRVRSSIADRDFLIGLFVELFEVTSSEESVRAQMAMESRGTIEPGGRDFRHDVELWLKHVARST